MYDDDDDDDDDDDVVMSKRRRIKKNVLKRNILDFSFVRFFYSTSTDVIKAQKSSFG